VTEQANQQQATAAKDKPAAKSAPPAPAGAGPGQASRGRLPWRIAGVLFVLLLLGGVWITWPLWSPALPGWLRGPLAPAMEAGRNVGLPARIEAVEKKLAAIEADIAAIKGEIAKRPAAVSSGEWA